MTVVTDPFSAEFPWPAPAKLNLFLHVTGRREDGYHTLQTVFQFLDFGDSLFFRARGDGQIERSHALEGIAAAEDLTVRAARLLQRASGCPLGTDIRIDKRIPLGGGLGGGSSDAATTLVALNRLWNLGFTVAELAEFGLALGADVPVFVRGRAAWAEGIGERMQPIELEEPWYLILIPPVQVSTAAVFADARLQRDCPRIDLETFRTGAVRNVLESVSCAQHPAVAEALAWLRRHGPARMSGSGAALFLACPDREQARAIAEDAARGAPAGCKALIARGLNRSPLASAMASQ